MAVSEYAPGSLLVAGSIDGGAPGQRRIQRGLRSPFSALVAIAAAYAALQVLLVGRMSLGWDETVYVSQVDPRVPAAFFSAPRARGVSWLVAPVVALTPSLPVLRTYLAVLSGAALVVSFGVWLRIRNDASVPLAAGIFAALWLSVFYGPAVMPNMWEAFAAVTATGCFLRCVGGEPGRAAPIGLGSAVVVAALIRPSDSLFLVAPLAGAALLVPRWRRPGICAVLAAATMLGWAPWLIEAYTSYGGPVARLHRGAQIQGGASLRFAADLQLRAINGPLLCRPCRRSAHPIPLVGTLELLATAAAVSVALASAHRQRTLAPSVLPLVVASSAAFPYLFLIGYAAPRFLLPAWALTCLPVGQTTLALWRGWPRPPTVPGTSASLLAGRAAVAGVLALHLLTQVTMLNRPVHSASHTDQTHTQLVTALKGLGIRPPCVITGEQAPPIAFYAGCASRQPTGHDASLTPDRLGALAATRPVVLLERGPPPAWAYGWRRVPLHLSADPRWTAYLPPPPS